jgi:DNA adenine methylase
MELTGFGTPYWMVRVGGKHFIKNRIIPLLPRNGISTYVEPFVGSGKIILANDPYPHEVVNDLDKDIYTLWKGMKSVKPSTLAGFDLTGNKLKFKQLKDSHFTTLPQKLYRALYLNIHSFSGNMIGYANVSRNAVLYKQKLLQHLPEIQERLKPMTILSQDWKTVVRKYDSPTTLFYLDPPYYEVENYGMKPVPPQDLYDVLSKLKGKWILSYNDVPIIRQLFKGYPIKSFSNINTIKSKSTTGAPTLSMKEVVIMNV